jgi:hypothetical protein
MCNFRRVVSDVEVAPDQPTATFKQRVLQLTLESGIRSLDQVVTRMALRVWEGRRTSGWLSVREATGPEVPLVVAAHAGCRTRN